MIRQRGTWAAGLCLVIGLVGCGLVGCGNEEPPIDRRGVNIVEKAVFEGSWYMARTVIDVDYEGSALGTFPGDAASDAASEFTALPRIRFVIDENYLFAYRDYDLTPGGDGESKGPEADSEAQKKLGEPVAAFAIEKHFDIRRAFNPSTGEEQNAIVENDTDNKWYERKFMRVDWSKNLLPGFYGQTYNLYELLGLWEREPTDLYVQDASAFPKSWQPRFDRMHCDGSRDQDEQCTQDERAFADDYAKDDLYHMSFVTQETLSPGLVDGVENWCASRYSDAPNCSSVVSYVRTSFLRVSDERQYEPVNWVDSRFDRFGYFRLSQSIADRSTGTPDDPAYFLTDFRNYNANRHNIWKQWHDADGKPVPYDDRQVRQILWYSTPELPAHLVRPSFDVVGQWNESLMQSVRQLRGEALPQYPEVDCQTDDPDGYCYCQELNGQVIRPTCPGHYDPFKAPEEYGDGVVDAYDCWVEVPEGAEPDFENPALSDSDFNEWFGARFVGDECVNVLRINACNRQTIAESEHGIEGLECQERGDMRFKFLSYVDQPGTDFLGIATLRGDPVTGEVVTGDANIGGPALDGYRTRALMTYDLVHGTVDEDDIIAGEDVRGYYENLGHVEQPARPRSEVSAAIESRTQLDPKARLEIDSRMQQAMQRVSRLQGPEGRSNIYSGRSQKLVGTDLERRLVSGLLDLGAGKNSATELTESVLDEISPFRKDIGTRLQSAREAADKLSRANVEMPNAYTDHSVQSFVNKHLDWSRARLEFGINRLLYRQTQLHELGHCLGLRHDFGGTADSDHYAPDYYAIAERLPLPEPSDFDTDGQDGLSASEQVELDRATQTVRSQREQLGIDGAMNSSVMDYTANWYERISPLGRYDHAAIAFGYGDLVQAYAGAPDAATPRETFLSYAGGEACETDADCPYASGGERSSELLATNQSAGITQRCVPSPRAATTKLCSSFDADLAAHADAGGEFQPLQYRFCTDDHAGLTLAWCNRFDEGASYREIVRNAAEAYDRGYIFSAFRRYRKDFSTSTYAGNLLGQVDTLQNIYQNLLFEYTSNPAFRTQTGPLGFYDQFLATTDILNFYARILGQPDVGGYVFNPVTGLYTRGYVEPSSPSADLPVPLGLGRYFYTDYQTGLSGIERIERVGTFIDKFIVLQTMTMRGSSPNYTRDVAFYTNYYDLFPNEMQQIFDGMIRDYPQAYMPRVLCDENTAPDCGNPRVVYMDFYRGDCSKTETCRPNPADVTYAGLPVLNGGGNITLQIYAAIFGLESFPVFFDASFQNQLFVCIEGQGDCVEPGATAAEGTDYVRYTSDRYLRSFLAFQVEPGVGVGEQTSIGFAMVKEARDSSALLDILTKIQTGETLTADDEDLLDELEYTPPTGAVLGSEITRLDGRVVDLESFFNQLIELQRDLGIQGFVYWQ